MRSFVIIADVNVLVYAFNESSLNHQRYAGWLAEALGGPDDFALVDAVLSGFLRIVTHPKIFAEPASTVSAMEFVTAVIEAPASRWLSSNRAAWDTLTGFADTDSAIRGNHIPDVYLASLAIANGARLATADRGLARYGRFWFDPAA